MSPRAGKAAEKERKIATVMTMVEGGTTAVEEEAETMIGVAPEAEGEVAQILGRKAVEEIPGKEAAPTEAEIEIEAEMEIKVETVAEAEIATEVQTEVEVEAGPKVEAGHPLRASRLIEEGRRNLGSSLGQGHPQHVGLLNDKPQPENWLHNVSIIGILAKNLAKTVCSTR